MSDADIEIALAAGAPSATLAGADTAFTFAQRVKSIIVQNNTGAPLYMNFDKAASPGSLLIAAGQTLVIPWSCTVVHLWTTAITTVNGGAAGGIFLDGGA